MYEPRCMTTCMHQMLHMIEQVVTYTASAEMGSPAEWTHSVQYGSKSIDIMLIMSVTKYNGINSVILN